MKKQHRNTKLVLNGEIVRQLSENQLLFAHGGRMKDPTTPDPGATIETCPISGDGCGSGLSACASMCLNTAC